MVDYKVSVYNAARDNNLAALKVSSTAINHIHYKNYNKLKKKKIPEHFDPSFYLSFGIEE